MSKKAGVRLNQLSKLHKKLQPESRILSSTSRKFIEDSGREIVGIKDGEGSEVTRGESKKYFFRLKILKDQKEIEVNYEEAMTCGVKTFKALYLKDYLEDGIHGARLIYNGREIKDSHRMEDFREDFQMDFDNDTKPLMHVFLYNIADRVKDTQ